jgi:hypothetical protein
MRIRAICCISIPVAAACFAAAALAFAPEKTVDRAVLKASQVGPGSTVRDIPHGTEVRGQVTLDVCGFGFKSERRRVARLQVTFIRNDGTGPFLSNEVVDYEHGWAKKAMKELRKAIATCPKGFVKSTIPGAGMIRNRFDPDQVVQAERGQPEEASLSERSPASSRIASSRSVGAPARSISRIATSSTIPPEATRRTASVKSSTSATRSFSM